MKIDLRFDRKSGVWKIFSDNREVGTVTDEETVEKLRMSLDSSSTGMVEEEYKNLISRHGIRADKIRHLCRSIIREVE